MRAIRALTAIAVLLYAAASDAALATPRGDLPDIYIGMPHRSGPPTREQLVRQAKRHRAMAASRAYWARASDGPCYRRPFFTAYGWRMASVCGGPMRIRFD